MPEMDYGLKSETIDSLRNVFNQHAEIESVILYGSRAKGNFKHGSDIDLTLTGEKVTQHLLYDLLAELDDLLLPYTIDLSIFSQISNPDLIEHIKRCGVSFYTKN